jgi:hypothetical protein
VIVHLARIWPEDRPARIGPSCGHCDSNDETRFHFNGVFFESDGSGLLFDLWDFQRYQLVRSRCDACGEIAAVRMRTNEGRAEFAQGRRRRRGVRVTPLMQLGTALQRGFNPRLSTPAAWAEVPDKILEDAFVHCEQRAERVSLHNARGRATAKWIGTWLRHIATAIDQRDRARRPKPPLVTITTGNATAHSIALEVVTNVTRRP